MLEENKVYKLSEFIEALKESQEFKPVLGKNVESEDKKNNGKAVDDILKGVKKYDGGSVSDKKTRKEDSHDVKDYNKTTLDSRFAYELTDDYKERVKAQVHGFASADNEKNSKVEKENKGVDFEGNKKFYDDREEIGKEMADRYFLDKKSGLKHRMMPDEYFKQHTTFKGENSKKDKDSKNESKKMKRLHFSKTVFLNEAEMIKKIPDDMKVDGNRFFMKDSIGNEYLIECKRDEVIRNFIHTNVVRYRNEEQLNEEFERMKYLAGYKSSDVQTRIDETNKTENSRVRNMLDETKKFVNKQENGKVLKTLLSENK